VSKRRRRTGGQKEPKTPAPPGGGWCPRIGQYMMWATMPIGLIAVICQPYDPAGPGCKDRTPPDETAHVVYVQHLLDKHTLPVLTSGGGNYEAHQPPLYYLTVAPAMALGRRMGRGSPVDHSGAPTPDVFLGRLWSVLIAAGVTLVSYLLACEVFPQSRVLQLAAPLLVLLLPGHIINLAAITNDGLAELFCGLVIWQCVVLIRRSPTRGRLIGIGVLIGAALLTKTSCLFLLPVAAAAVLLSASPWAPEPSSWRRCVAGLGLIVGPALLLWAPWIAHNLANYPGDPLVARTFMEVFGKDRWTPERFYAQGMSELGYWRLVLTWTYLSFWGVFGSAMVFMPGGYYLAATAVSLVSLIGCLRGLARWWRSDRETRCVWSLLALAVILVCLQFLSFNRTFFQAQARYLFPAIGPIVCLFVAGLHLAGQRLGGARGALWVPALTGLAMVALLVAALAEVAARGPVGLPVWL
jgi:4-amino-4-deoxy-L-arabinose transferase-like glycosyltransferase